MIYPTTKLAHSFPGQPAVIEGSHVVTHADLERCIVEAAQRMIALGVVRDDRVALLAHNSMEWIVITHAVSRLGAILVPINTRLAKTEIRDLLELYDPRLVLVDAETKLALDGEALLPDRVVCLGAPSGEARRWWSEVQPARNEISAEIDPERICTIISTSGTAGTPKGVCLSLANHLAAAEASERNLRSGPADRWLVNLPFFHVGGLSVIYRSVVSRIAMVVHKRFSVQDTIDAIEHSGITHLSLVENTLARLLDAWGERRFPLTVRGVLVGGGPVNVVLLRRARGLGLPVLPTYGLTEADSQVATLSPDAPEELLSTVGCPLYSCEVEIRDASGKAVPRGVAGEIAIRGPIVARGYWTAGHEVTSTLNDEWFLTRDVGVFDNQGHLTILGRADDMIVSGGEKVFPTEIEGWLTQIPGVRDAAVVAVDDPQWGRVPVAFIEFLPKKSMAPREIAAALAGRLASFKIPRRFVAVAQLPRTEMGKIDRGRLAALVRTSSEM